MWQIELSDESGASALVGIEGGAQPFDEAPRYDRRALDRDTPIERFRIAGLQLGDRGPRGAVHVATLHVAYRGDEPGLSARIEVAAAPGGRHIEAEVELR